MVNYRLKYLRRRLSRQNRQVVIGIASATIAICLVVILWMVYRMAVADRPTHPRAWFYDLNRKTLFVADADTLPPVPTDSGLAKVAEGVSIPAGVRAWVFSCGDCADKSQRFIGYLSTFTPQTRDQHIGESPQGMIDHTANAMDKQLVTAENPMHWVPVTTPQGSRIMQEALDRCGNKVAMPCFPD